jgi:glutaredoxin
MRGRWRSGLVSAILSIATLALPAATPAGSAGLPPAAPGTRAMWLWGDQAASDVVTWASTHGVQEIFVHVFPAVMTNGDLPRLRDMRKRADAAKIRLTALGGDGAWTTDHTAALAWQRAVVATGVFSGLHVDVEPYLTAGWTSDLTGTATAYLSLLDKLRAGSRLPVEADVPFWYGQYTIAGKNLATEVLRRVSAVTVMSYRDTGTGPNSILAISQDWLTRGAAYGKRVRLGAETGALADCPHCTFAEEGATALGTELAKVDAATRKTYAYAGIAVHRYGTWRALPA